MIKHLIKYVEVQTKITSLLTFILTLGVMLYHDVSINILNTCVFFLGMFTFDLTTTAINNYIDSKSNNQDLGFSRIFAKLFLFALFGISVVLGLLLVYLTDYIVLLIGGFCFFVGVIYTYGPIAISRQPYGEIVSGVLYGYFIPFLLIYINMGQEFLSIDPQGIVITLKLIPFIGFLIYGLVPTILTACIMLGNNTCDVEADIQVNRFTLPYYIGKQNAYTLLKILYVLVYISILVGVVTGLYHPIVLLTLVTIPKVSQNIRDFGIDMVKHLSFVNVIKNFLLIMISLIVFVYLSIIV